MKKNYQYWELNSEGKRIKIEVMDINPETLSKSLLDFMLREEASFLTESYLIHLFRHVQEGTITVDGKRAYTKDDLELAFSVGEHLDEYQANSGIQDFDDWFKDEYETEKITG
jgi:hypothetical protein